MEIKFEHVNFIIDTYTPLEKTILSDVSFCIKGPGIYSFVGKSNSGKTAIGDLINALVVPNSGLVKVGDFVNNKKRIKNINKLRCNTGYVFRNPYDMLFNSSVRKELEFGMRYFKYKTKNIKERVNNALKLVDLDPSLLNMYPQNLDLVDAKKLALASTLVYNPEVIILDEYTNGLTYSDKKEFIRIVKLLKNKYKRTIIILTKDTDLSYEISDYVYLMEKTKIVTHGDKRILRDSELLKSIGLKVPSIVSFIEEYKKKSNIDDYSNILDLIKGVYRDVL